jgi:uncharacterized membrane protein
MNQIKVSAKRHLAKTITWRIIGTIDTIILSWLITGQFKIGLAIGGVEVISKMILYYLHERAWYKYIKYGLTKIKIEEPKKEEEKEEQKTKRLVYTKKTN